MKHFLLFFGIIIISIASVVAQNTNSDPPLVPFSNGINFGFKDSLTQKIHIMPVFNGAGVFYGRYAKVKVNGKWGVINKKGEHIIELKYDSVLMLRNNFFLCYLISKTFLLDDKKNIIGTYDNFLQFEDNSGISGLEAFPAINYSRLGNNVIYIVNNGGQYLNIIRTDTVRVEHGDGMSSKYFIEKKAYPYIFGGRFCILNNKAEPLTISGLRGVKLHVKRYDESDEKKQIKKYQLLVDISDKASVERAGLRYIDLSKPIYINVEGKWQIINSNGKILSAEQFDSIEIFNGTVVGLLGKIKYLISEEGKISKMN